MQVGFGAREQRSFPGRTPKAINRPSNGVHSTLAVEGDLGLRSRGVETTTYRLRARLVSMKVEEDSDVHLVIADTRDPSETMIVEFPASDCTRGAKRALRLRMSDAKRRLFGACGTPGASGFTSLTGRATITGVGFFDFRHGQRGVAPNGIELHPVIGFSNATC